MKNVEDVNLLETKGIDLLSENERVSKPSDIGFALGGGQLCFAIMVVGALPVVFGLGWWSSFSALTIGLLIGCMLASPFALLGRKTGTTGVVSSGAHFGVNGRVIGAILLLLVSLGFYVLTIFTGSQALMYSFSKLFGWPEGTIILTVTAIILGIGIGVITIFGHTFVLVVEKLGVWIIGAILIAAVLLFMPEFNPSYSGSGEYLLGGFWPTWLLSVTVGLTLPIAVSPLINDYARYVPTNTSARSVIFGTGIGLFIGCFIAYNSAAYFMTMFEESTTPLVQGVIGMSPLWFVPAFMVVGILGTIASGCFSLYSTGLALEGLNMGNRIITTIAVSIVGLLIIIFILYAYDFLGFIDAFVDWITVAISPWLTINLVGFYLFRGQYSPLELLKPKGLYWYTKGFNIPAVVSWIFAVIVGALFSSTGIFVGSLAGIAGGVDISFISSAVIGPIIYYLLVKSSLSESEGTPYKESNVK